MQTLQAYICTFITAITMLLTDRNLNTGCSAVTFALFLAELVVIHGMTGSNYFTPADYAPNYFGHPANSIPADALIVFTFRGPHHSTHRIL